MYQAYIFDVDGTLLDTAPTILDCIAKAIENSGLKVDKATINQSLIGPKIADIVEILKLSTIEADKQNVVKYFRYFYDNLPTPRTIVYPQGIALYEQAKKEKALIFVATNKPIKPTEKLLQYFKLDGFTDVYTPDKFVGKTLSKTDMLRCIIDQHHLSPANILFIGDTKGDLEAAKESGCKFAFAMWGYAKDKDLISKQADIILNNGKESTCSYNYNERI